MRFVYKLKYYSEIESWIQCIIETKKHNIFVVIDIMWQNVTYFEVSAHKAIDDRID